MRRLFPLAVLSAIAGAIYIVSPFWAAWQLREAIRTGDRDTISRKVEWPSVRASLRESISHQSELLPSATALGSEVKPTFWQRVKSAFGATMLDRFVESYITPDGLPKLANHSRGWRNAVTGKTTDQDRPWNERVAEFYSRVKRAEFTGLAQALIEVADRDDPKRSFVGVFEFHGFEWKLTKLRILSAQTAAQTATR